jgi:hypothetical protein
VYDGRHRAVAAPELLGGSAEKPRNLGWSPTATWLTVPRLFHDKEDR